MDGTHNAGQTVEVKQVSPMPVVDADWGTITITENWGRLFIRKGDSEIIVHQRFYADLVAAISSFIPPDTIHSKEPSQ